jgi:hypothetical protein
MERNRGRKEREKRWKAVEKEKKGIQGKENKGTKRKGMK